MVQALEDIKKQAVTHSVYILETSDRRFLRPFLQKHFEGPKMFIAATEETQDNLCQGRGDAYCGMLNASYNLQLRNVKPIFRSIR